MAWLAGLPAPFRKGLDVGSSKAAWRRPTCHYVQVFNTVYTAKAGPYGGTSLNGLFRLFIMAVFSVVLLKFNLKIA